MTDFGPRLEKLARRLDELRERGRRSGADATSGLDPQYERLAQEHAALGGQAREPLDHRWHALDRDLEALEREVEEISARVAAARADEQDLARP